MTTPTDVTFVANTTPAITAAWLNGINDWVNGWYGAGTGVLGASSGSSYTANTLRTALSVKAFGTGYETYAWASITPASPATNSAFSPANKTITFAEAGTYLVHLNARSGNSGTYTAHEIRFGLSGTATRNDVLSTAISGYGIVAQQSNIYETFTVEVTATAGQTLIIEPTVNSTYSSGTHTFYASYVVQAIA